MNSYTYHSAQDVIWTLFESCNITIKDQSGLSWLALYFPKDALAAMFHWSHSIKDSTKPSLICVPMFQSDKKYSPYFKTKNYRTNRQMDEWTEIPFNKSIMYNNVQ